MKESDKELKKIIRSLFLPLLFVVICWIILGLDVYFNLDLYKLGIYPLKTKGLAGILFCDFIHADYKHLASNSIPLIVLGGMLFYFYPEKSILFITIIWILGNTSVWFIGRPSWHIGASGLIYGLAAFHIFRGFLVKNRRLTALSMTVIFLYGSLVWGIFPEFFPKENISWEAHLSGFTLGLIMAFILPGGPKSDPVPDDDIPDDDPYWLVLENNEIPNENENTSR
jgi:membrane associated rhomboid family serine protease